MEYLKVVAIKSKRRFVPELFIEDLEAATTGPTKLKCPEDSEVLQAAAPLGVALDWCPSCYGVWFDNGELKKLLAMHPHHAEGTNVGVDSLVAGEAALEILFTALSLFK